MEYNELLKTIDTALQAARDQSARIGRGPAGREISLVITKLQEARLWTEQAKREEIDARQADEVSRYYPK